MNYGEGGLSASDVALLTGSNRSNNGDGFGGGFGGYGWWVIIFLIFAFLGWGRNGFGGNDGGGSNGSGSVMDAYVLNSDFATLQRLMESGFDRVSNGINQVNQGICNLGYSTLENFNTTNMGVATGFANLNNALCNQSFQIERGITGLGSQLSSCCCDLRQQIADTSCGTLNAIQNVNYNMAMNTNAIQNTLCNNTRDLLENQNSNYRQLHDEIVNNRIEDKNNQIALLQTQLNNAELRASQQAQSEYLLNQLRNGCPVNAQLVCGNTPIPVQYIGANGCGYNTGCGCGSY